MRTSSITIENAPGADVFAQNVPVRCVRNGLPLISNHRRSSGLCAYLRRLRAAEMAAWELSGGDYLLPHWAARIGSR